MRVKASPCADLGGGWGLILSDEADRMTTSSRPAGVPSLYGRDCAGMLGNYAADYAVLELFTAEKSTLYRIV